MTINGWSPRNFEPEFMGQVTLEQALAHSINTVAARLADEIGRDNVAATAHRLGIVSTINTDPAMALGTSLVTPLEMAQAYDTFGNGGYRAQAYGIERIRTAGGQVLFQHRQPPLTVAVANPALGEMQQMMRSVMKFGTGTHAVVQGYDLAGKTGTTSDFKDAWFCGYTGGPVMVVWTGCDDATLMRGSPATARDLAGQHARRWSTSQRPDPARAAAPPATPTPVPTLPRRHSPPAR